MQGDMAKSPEKRLNYKHCFDALFRVSSTPHNQRGSFGSVLIHIIPIQMVREEGLSSLTRGIGPNVIRAVLMNSSQLAS